VRFYKVHGLGNDFILLDARNRRLDWHRLAPRLCDRHFGIGADGLLLLETGEKAPFKMRIINADGSEAEMCGNGIRCFAKYLADHSYIPADQDELEVETLARLRRDCDNVVGVKEANRDFEHVNRVLWACGRDFLLFSGIEVLCYPMLAIGGAGFISATANLVPDRCAQLYERWRAGDVRGALELHYDLLPLNEVLFVETNPGPVKYALGLMGRIAPEVRLPLVLPSEANRRRIRETLVRYGLLSSEAVEVSG